MTTTESIQQLYVAYFNRPADVAGLNYWVGEVNAGRLTLTQTSKTFAATPEYIAAYAGLGNDQIVAQVYMNLFNRLPEQGGLNYWVAELLAGRQTVDTLVNTVSNTALANSNTDSDAINAKIDAAVAFTDYLNTDVALRLAYHGDALQTGKDYVAGVTDAASLTTAVADLADTMQTVVVAGTPVGDTLALTVDAEQKTGSTGNDIFNGSDTTLVLDVLNGAAGVDTLNYSDATGGVDINSLGLTLSKIEIINVRSTGVATADTSGFDDVTNLNALKGVGATLVAGDTTNVSVSGITDDILVDGGKNIVVTDAKAGNDITIGSTTGATGNITVTDTNVAGGAIAVDGGKDVALTLTGSNASTIAIGNGGAATDLPTGVVSVTSANKAVAGADETLSGITVKGGTTVSVAQTATSTVAATDTTGATVTLGAVAITAGTTTTSVTANQTASTLEVVAATADAGKTETASVKFGALTATKTLIAGGLTFTATQDMTAAQVAAVFANLVDGTIPAAGDTQGGGAASNGTYTNAFTGWTSGAAVGDTVVFTSTTATTNVGPLTFAGTSVVAPVVTGIDGAGATVAKTGVLGVVAGTVEIDDNATAASVTTVSVDGYGDSSTIGAANNVDKLATLSLAHSGGTFAGDTDATMDVYTAATSLNFTVNAVKGAVSLDAAAATVKTLNLTATGANSTFALTAAAVETLAVAGDKVASLTVDLAAVKTVTVTGSAGLTLSGNEGNSLTSVTTTGTTGTVTATIEGARATYTGGAGVDVVTLATDTALTKAISLGAGDDTLVFGALAVASSTAALAGGEGTDTLSMTFAVADGLDAAAQTFYTGFERLTISDTLGTTTTSTVSATLDLANLGFTNYVTTSGTLGSGTLTLNKLASNGTVVLTDAGLVTVAITDAATGTADVLNLVLSSDDGIDFGTLTAANVETVKLTSTDTDTVAGANTNDLILTANKATSVTVTGDTDLNLVLTGSVKATLIDASTLTGDFVATSVNTTSATTIKGGLGNDILTAATGTTADVLLGGAGDDTLVANAGLDTLTGGAGNDLFVIATASLNSSSYATITDFAAGDLIQFAGADSFKAAKVTQGDTAVFQDFANAAINAIGANDLAWFQFGGNTYIVEDSAGNDVTFVNGTDLIVKLTGLVDLTNASFNATHNTIAL